MTMLTQIGNSKGIRIPKSIIKQAHLEDVELDFEIVENGLLIKPILDNTRKNWEKNILELNAKSNKDEGLLEDFLNDNDLEDFEW